MNRWGVWVAWVAWVVLFDSGCATTNAKPTTAGVYMHKEITLDHDQVIVCFYDLAEDALYCRDPASLPGDPDESKGDKPRGPRILEIREIRP